MSDVVVIDYGVGNLLSVRRGLEKVGARVTLSSDPEEIRRAPRVVLPGVGAFAAGMEELRRHGLDAVVRDVARAGTPLLGICLGMQMLLDRSEEFGETEGLGLIPGTVLEVPGTSADGESQKIPHIGWANLSRPDACASWQGTIFADVREGDEVYFVHSYMAEPAGEEYRLADAYYGGKRVTAAVGRENVMGCQFHPEKSGDVGLRILRRFVTPGQP